VFAISGEMAEVHGPKMSLEIERKFLVSNDDWKMSVTQAIGIRDDRAGKNARLRGATASAGVLVIHAASLTNSLAISAKRTARPLLRQT